MPQQFSMRRDHNNPSVSGEIAAVIITVTCDWDGLDYPVAGPHNPGADRHFRFHRGLQAIQYFNRHFGGRIPLTHFICPVYFTRSLRLTGYYAPRISELVAHSNCEVGLHLHGWMSLVQACGLTPADPVQDPELPDWGTQGENRLGLSVPYVDDAGLARLDYGHGVPLGVYPQDEIVQLAQAGRGLLLANQIIASAEACRSFRCGGWLANDAVLAALQNTQPAFQYEASAVDAAFFPAGSGALADWLRQLWGSRRQSAQTFLSNQLFLAAYPQGLAIHTHSNAVTEAQPRLIQNLLEIPDTALLADYVEAGFMVDQVARARAAVAQQESDVYVSLGFHLESGGDPRFGKVFGHLERVIEALDEIERRYGGAIHYLTIAEAGRRWHATRGRNLGAYERPGDKKLSPAKK
ncbi:MAG: hypothetical protein DKINENOH_00439 [bacterium]|nr:hypothetical protein [bacterium]